MDAFIAVPDGRRIEQISISELLRMYRLTRGVVASALAGDAEAQGRVHAVCALYQQSPHNARIRLGAKLLYEAFLEERERAAPSEEKAIEVRTQVTGCSAEHPEDIPCENCSNTFVRPAKRERGEARA